MSRDPKGSCASRAFACSSPDASGTMLTDRRAPACCFRAINARKAGSAYMSRTQALATLRISRTHGTCNVRHSPSELNWYLNSLGPDNVRGTSVQWAGQRLSFPSAILHGRVDCSGAAIHSPCTMCWQRGADAGAGAAVIGGFGNHRLASEARLHVRIIALVLKLNEAC